MISLQQRLRAWYLELQGAADASFDPTDARFPHRSCAADLAQLLGSWGQCPLCPADLTGDGIVDATDLAFLLGGWGPCE